MINKFQKHLEVMRWTHDELIKKDGDGIIYIFSSRSIVIRITDGIGPSRLLETTPKLLLKMWKLL